jgi:hypothetical protein
LNAQGDFFVIGERLYNRNLTGQARRDSGADQFFRVNEKARAYALLEPVLAQVAHLCAETRKATCLSIRNFTLVPHDFLLQLFRRIVKLDRNETLAGTVG